MRKAMLVGLVLVFSSIGCGKKASEENAKQVSAENAMRVSEEKAQKVKPGMTKAEVEALLGSGRSVGSGQYEWTTEKGRLTVSFTNDKVSSFIFQGAPRVESDDEKAKERARLDALWAEQKRDSDRILQDRDRINALQDVYVLLFAAVGAGDRLPANEAAAAASPLATVNNGMDAIRSGRVVMRWGASEADDVWAYE